MKFNSNAQLTYPCLNINQTDGKPVPKVPFHIIFQNRAISEFELVAKTQNEEICNLIQEGKAQFCLELDCHDTFVRKAFLSKTGVFHETLNNNDYNGNLVGEVTVVATAKIENYQNSVFDEFYKQFSITIDPGEVLAYLGKFEWQMELKNRAVKTVDDFFVVAKGTDTQKYVHYELGQSSIEIHLPPTLHKMYIDSQIGENLKYEATFHVSFLLPSLIQALQEIGNFPDNKWAIALRNHIEQKEELYKILASSKDAKVFEEECAMGFETASELAQAILDNPYVRMINGMIEKESNNED